MAQHSRTLVQAFAEACGLDPKRIRWLHLEADAKDGVLEATFGMYPEMTEADIATFTEAVRSNPDSLKVDVVEVPWPGE